jgi:DNA-binding MarR family transcriptional regulator
VTRPSSELVQLDELLLRLVRAVRGTGYRGRMLQGVPELSGIGSLRVLRSIEERQRQGRDASIRDVAADLEIEQSTASRAVNVLVGQGLVTRATDADDQRRTVLALSDAGKSVVDRATVNRMEMLAETTEGWPAADLRALGTLLERLVLAYEGVRPSA